MLFLMPINKQLTNKKCFKYIFGRLTTVYLQQEKFETEALPKQRIAIEVLYLITLLKKKSVIAEESHLVSTKDRQKIMRTSSSEFFCG